MSDASDRGLTALGIETSGRTGSVAVNVGVGAECRIVEREFIPPRGHGKALLAEVEAVLDTAGLSLQAVDVFVGNAGPGSFTGLRTGLATVTALAWSLGKRSAAFGSLESQCHGYLRAGGRAEWVAPVIDARKSEVFGALYRVDGSALETVIPACAMAPQAFREQVLAAMALAEATADVVFVGTGTVAYPELLPGDGAGQLTAGDLVSLALSAPELPPARPRYVRPSSAEVKFGAAPAHDPMGNLVG